MGSGWCFEGQMFDLDKYLIPGFLWPAAAPPLFGALRPPPADRLRGDNFI